MSVLDEEEESLAHFLESEVLSEVSDQVLTFSSVYLHLN